MILQLHLSGSLVFEAETDILPRAGDAIAFRMMQSKKGIEKGTLVSATVVDDGEGYEFDFTGSKPIVRLAMDEFRELPG